MKLSHHRSLSLALAFGAIVATRAMALAAADVAKDREQGTRLQIFLDRANFGPGKIDGRYGDFTHKALKLYLEAHEGDTPAAKSAGGAAESAETSKPKDRRKQESAGESAPKKLAQADLEKLDLSSVDPVFIEYEVTEGDLKDIKALPKEIPELAKLKSLPYASAAEAIAEKFHCDLDYLKELNPGKLDALKQGDMLKVPNVEPFDLAAVRDEETKTDKSQDKPDPSKPEEPRPLESAAISITIDTTESMLRLLEDGRLTAAYPVTVGSETTESPIGEWKVKGIAHMPDFRYDESMLEKGKRSDDAFVLPPGPNNLVGVIWIALDKPGIGIHGTSEPDTIGRSESHGCIRMANWDVVRLAPRVPVGAVVTIQK